MKCFGLIGYPVGHSLSQRYFVEKWRRNGVYDRSYNLYELKSLDGLDRLVACEGLSGFNVTLPHKQAIMPLIGALTDEAAAVGAVNCVKVTPNGFVGHNTDCQAFADTLQPLLQPWHTSALVLGTGGAAAAVELALKRLGIESLKVSRTPTDGCIGYAEAALIAPSRMLIVNATPVGMSPHTDNSPWPWPELLTDRHLVYDLVYTPSPTLLLTQAAAHGAQTFGGLPMLYRQADLSEEFWLADKEM
ncbi:MAG: shikimate dehydrogenase [Bacteroidales bacterium]|nr:shikimate dehydrogenase [Bacteroidales bacterium]